MRHLPCVWLSSPLRVVNLRLQEVYQIHYCMRVVCHSPQRSLLWLPFYMHRRLHVFLGGRLLEPFHRGIRIHFRLGKRGQRGMKMMFELGGGVGLGLLVILGVHYR
jgi:hypothetical protein